MISVPTRPLAARVSIGVVGGVLVALLLIGYGVLRIPATSLRSVAAAALMLVLYAVVGWTIIPRIATRNLAIIQAASWAGLLAGAIFTLEIVLENIILPADRRPAGRCQCPYQR